MESGPLSDAAFPGFATKVVPYLNIMTRISGHPHDEMLTEKGYRGHPTLAFMNVKGEVLGRPLDRSIESFEATLTAINDYAKLTKRSAAGEKNLEYQTFLLERTLSKLRGKKLVAAGKALKGLDPEQQLVVDRILLGVEVDDLILMSLRGPEAVAQAGKRMREILESGRHPDLVKSANAWSVLSRYGEQIGDADLIDRCAVGLRKNFSGDKRMVDWATSLEKKASALRSKRSGG